MQGLHYYFYFVLCQYGNIKLKSLTHCSSQNSWKLSKCSSSNITTTWKKVIARTLHFFNVGNWNAICKYLTCLRQKYWRTVLKLLNIFRLQIFFFHFWGGMQEGFQQNCPQSTFWFLFLELKQKHANPLLIQVKIQIVLFW